MKHFDKKSNAVDCSKENLCQQGKRTSVSPSNGEVELPYLLKVHKILNKRVNGETSRTLHTTSKVIDKNSNVSNVKNSSTNISMKITVEQALEKEAIVYKQAEEILEKRTLYFGERVKGLNCLYGLSKLIEKPGISIDEILEGTINIIPPSWPYPDITCAKLTFKNQEFRTKNYKKTKWTQSAEIVVHGKKVGELFVTHLEERPIIDEFTFLKEESLLINALSERIGKLIESTQAETALRESRERFLDFFENAPVGFHIFGPDQIILEINETELSMIGYTRDEIVGKKRWGDLIVNEQKTIFEKHWKQLLKGNRITDLEYTLVHKKGHLIDVSLNCSGHYDANGLLESTRGSVIDISERKRAEEDREKALLEAKQANNVKDLFLANMSHEIRTPLNTILGFTDLIEESSRHTIGEEERGFFNIIQTSGERLMHTVHEILDISQIEAGTYVKIIEDFNLMILVKELVDGMQMQAKEKQLNLEFHSTRKHIRVRADRNGISKSIVNIIDNGIKYTEKGKISVELRQKSKSAILTIQDTGIGMSREYLEKIFEVFTQESEGYTKKYQGIGLGMAIAGRHLNLSHVKIAVESTQGNGTTLTLTFPNPQNISDQ